MARSSVRRTASWALGVLAATFSGLALGVEWNLQPPATAIAADVHALHEYVMILVTVIFVGVFGFMFYAVLRHRKDRNHRAAQWHENTTVELLWTIVPLIILVVIAWPATKVVLAQKDTSNPDLTIKVTGYQWRWGYDYLKGEGAGIHFISALSTPREQIEGKAPKDAHYLLEVDHPLVVPVGKKVRVVVTAADVIHSWWVPAFSVKQDAMPGFLRDTHFRADRVGVYRGQCAELCGKEHGFMPVVVRVVSQADYTKWVAAQQRAATAAADNVNRAWTLDELKARGAKVYASVCAACHQPNGQGSPPAFPPLDGSKVVNGPKAAHLDVVMNGRPNTAMQAFAKQMSDVEIAAVVTFERNSWGNKTGDLVQPAEVHAARNQ
jgi:cytochrome c oxidase subunit 2